MPPFHKLTEPRDTSWRTMHLHFAELSTPQHQHHLFHHNHVDFELTTNSCRRRHQRQLCQVTLEIVGHLMQHPYQMHHRPDHQEYHQDLVHQRTHLLFLLHRHRIILCSSDFHSLEAIFKIPHLPTGLLPKIDNYGNSYRSRSLET